MPFAQGSEVFEQLTLANLSDQSLDKAAQAYGQEMKEVETESVTAKPTYKANQT
ncbi:MAG: hypothetical protein GY943_34530 [Chloroflexi bacterium]|nr:hypothetical protein [Chloroflexota bacterium]